MKYPFLLLPCLAAFQFPLHAADQPTAIQETPSPVIASVAPETPPLVPIPSNGDLWLNTWAADDNIYTGWGDGQGPGIGTRTDCGIARLLGNPPDLFGEIRSSFAPKTNGLPHVNDKPSSLLYLDGQLVGAFHSPLGDAWIGYLAVSHDLGATWTRLGFYDVKDPVPRHASPWTRDRKSNFRCLFFINMGQAYRLNTDGYVYAMAIGMEWNWASREVYLCRVPRKEVLDYSAYRYFTGLADGKPGWSIHQDDARPLEGVHTDDQGSAMFHPQLGRYLFLTQDELFDAPAPWGPWTSAGTWHKPGTPGPGGTVAWQGGYMPGIISKATGPDSFWFTISGQNHLPHITYRLQIGQMRMVLRPGSEVRVTTDPVSRIVAGGTKVDLSVIAAGAGPISYQWKKDGKPIPGATEATMTIKSAAIEDAGSYNCDVSDSHHTATSGTATLLVYGYCPP